MKLYQRIPFAAAVMVIAIALSSVGGMMKTVITERHKVEDAFVLGCSGDGNSIQSDLGEIINYTHNFRGIAVKYLGSDHSLISDMTEKAEELSNADSVSEKAAALDSLYLTVSEVWRMLQDSSELSETDIKSCKIAFYDIDDRCNKISHDGYNALANEYNKMLDGFPVTLLKVFGFAEPAELFD
ncbi:MAG: hypothetical protein IJA85_09690 [Clostridia bacterium]|nr:hypothetical protein [Clostridia bacterium]MBQ4575444.1 hypothetical protein [Clostridia bacterium]